jgi:hypothetical protein
MRVRVALVVPLISVLLAHAAYAQQPADVAPRDAPAPAQSAAPSAGSKTFTVTAAGGYACALGEWEGMGESDARTSVDVICGAISSHHARPGTYDIRMGTLGQKILLVVSERESSDERRLFIAGPEEVPLAADRIATALVEHRTVAETQGVDNVVSSEIATPLRKTAPLSFFVGATATSVVGYDANMSAGAETDVELRSNRLAVALQGRAGGISTGENFLGFWSVGASARYYLSDSETSVFVGAGPTLGYVKANVHDVLAGYDALGFGGAAEVGASFQRASHAGVVIAIRADVPAFNLKNTTYDWSNNNLATVSYMYVASGSVVFGMSFR